MLTIPEEFFEHCSFFQYQVGGRTFSTVRAKFPKSNIMLLDRPCYIIGMYVYTYLYLLHTYIYGGGAACISRRRPPVSTGMKAILVKHEKFNCTSLGGVPQQHYSKIEKNFSFFYCLQQIGSLLHWVGPLTNAR